MIVYRLAREKYATSLFSSGAANRWNRNGQHVIYCSENISLCALELLAHTNGIKPVGKFSLMRIEIVEPVLPHVVELTNLPKNWHHLSSYAYTQKMGSDWYDTQESLCMRVPSIIVPSERNYIINTLHHDFLERVRLVDTQNFFWDNRFPSG
jgi:RES domain-containing protein